MEFNHFATAFLLEKPTYSLTTADQNADFLVLDFQWIGTPSAKTLSSYLAHGKKTGADKAIGNTTKTPRRGRCSNSAAKAAGPRPERSDMARDAAARRSDTARDQAHGTPVRI